MIFLITKKNKGFSLAETLIYIGGLTVLLVVILNSLSTLFVSYKKISTIRHLEVSAISAMDRLTREIRNATSINMLESSLGSHPSEITLDTSSTFSSSTVKFRVVGGRLYISKDGGTEDPITSGKVMVSNFVLRNISTTKSDAVKIELTLVSDDINSVEKKFYNTVVLRGSYSK